MSNKFLKIIISYMSNSPKKRLWFLWRIAYITNNYSWSVFYWGLKLQYIPRKSLSFKWKLYLFASVKFNPETKYYVYKTSHIIYIICIMLLYTSLYQLTVMGAANALSRTFVMHARTFYAMLQAILSFLQRQANAEAWYVVKVEVSITKCFNKLSAPFSSRIASVLPSNIYSIIYNPSLLRNTWCFYFYYYHFQ